MFISSESKAGKRRQNPPKKSKESSSSHVFIYFILLTANGLTKLLTRCSKRPLLKYTLYMTTFVLWKQTHCSHFLKPNWNSLPVREATPSLTVFLLTKSQSCQCVSRTLTTEFLCPVTQHARWETVSVWRAVTTDADSLLLKHLLRAEHQGSIACDLSGLF